MNQVVIKQSYLSYHSEIEINGYKVGAYSNLSAIGKRPFAEVADVFISQLDREFYDDYTIEYCALPFQYNILKSLAKDSEYCKEIAFSRINMPFDADYIYAKVSELFVKYGLQLGLSTSIKVYIDDETIEVPVDRKFEKSTIEEGEIAIVGNQDFVIPENIKTLVIMSDEYGFDKKDNCTIFKIVKEDLTDFWDYYFMFEKMIPYLVECMTAFKYIKLSEEDRIMLEVIRTGKAAYYVGDIPEVLDKKDVVSVEFFSFPEEKFNIKSTNMDVLRIEDGKICAFGAGKAEIQIADSEGNICQSNTVVVVAHQYVQNITIMSDFKYLKKNQKAHVSILCEPVMAEDVDDLVWTSSQEQVVHVDNNGNIYALSEGTATITVKGKEAVATLEVEVKPKLRGMKILQESVFLQIGETTVVDVELDPPNAPADALRWEFDNKSIATCNPSKTGLRCQIVASTQYTGSGNLRCIDSESNICAVTPIEVKAPNTGSKSGCGGCLLAALGFFVILLILGALV